MLYTGLVLDNVYFLFTKIDNEYDRYPIVIKEMIHRLIYDLWVTVSNAKQKSEGNYDKLSAYLAS